MPYTFPHVPLHASDAARGKSPRGLYGDVVEEIDSSVGRILDCIREQGLAGRTLVFFSSDNGPWLNIAAEHPDVVADLFKDVATHKTALVPAPSQMEARIETKPAR